MEDGGPADHTRPSSLESPTIVFDSTEHARAALAKTLPRGVPRWVPDSRFRPLDDGRLTWRSDIAGRVRWSAEGGEPLIKGLWPYVEAIRCRRSSSAAPSRRSSRSSTPSGWSS